ncbi:MAG: diguanylate cyclase, partial [Sulfurospirillum sp.]|nr:diguanylate cyclase [Sulfurospirillum sp.]
KDHLPSLKRTIDLVDYVRSRIDFFAQVVLKAKSHFIFESNVSHANIFFNETKLQRIIDNNLTNAIKYTFENSAIHIVLHVKNLVCTFSIASHSRKILEPEKVFEEYYRENSAHYGFGLGLTLVKNICDEENIGIHLHSDEEKTIFSYQFLLEAP